MLQPLGIVLLLGVRKYKQSVLIILTREAAHSIREVMVAKLYDKTNLSPDVKQGWILFHKVFSNLYMSSRASRHKWSASFLHDEHTRFNCSAGLGLVTTFTSEGVSMDAPWACRTFTMSRWPSLHTTCMAVTPFCKIVNQYTKSSHSNNCKQRIPTATIGDEIWRLAKAMHESYQPQKKLLFHPLIAVPTCI